MTHLLKYRFQPDQRSSSWRGSIVGHPADCVKLLRESPSLLPIARGMFSECNADSCEQAAAESALSPDSFPAEPPFTLEQILYPSTCPTEPRICEVRGKSHAWMGALLQRKMKHG